MANIWELADVWNDAGQDSVGIGQDIADSGSGAGSMMMRLRRNGVDMASISKLGAMVLAAGITAGGALAAPSGAIAGNLDLTTNASMLRIGAAQDVVLNRDAADVLALFRSINPQTLRLYNTRTDASNYERATFGWVSNALVIGTEAAGTGSGRNLQFSTSGTSRWQVNAASGHLIAVADNTYDIGASGANRPRNIYAGSNIFAASLMEVGAPGIFGFGGRSSIISPTNGNLTLLNNAGTDFSLLQFGGTTSSFPALRRSGASFDVRLADDTAFGAIRGKLTTETAYSAGVIVPTGSIILYDSAGTAYKVPAVAA